MTKAKVVSADQQLHTGNHRLNPKEGYKQLALGSG
jgi:hypothetical protein